jgi:hypothetical protein
MKLVPPVRNGCVQMEGLGRGAGSFHIFARRECDRQADSGGNGPICVKIPIGAERLKVREPAIGFEYRLVCGTWQRDNEKFLRLSVITKDTPILTRSRRAVWVGWLLRAAAKSENLGLKNGASRRMGPRINL